MGGPANRGGVSDTYASDGRAPAPDPTNGPALRRQPARPGRLRGRHAPTGRGRLAVAALAVVLVVAALGSLAAAAYAETLSQRQDRIERQKAAKRERIQALGRTESQIGAQVDQQDQVIGVLRTRIAKLAARVAVLNGQLGAARDRLADLQRRLTLLNGRLDSLQGRLQRQQRALANRVVQMVRDEERPTTLELLLDSGSLAEVESRADFENRLTAEDQAIIDGVSAVRAAVDREATKVLRLRISQARQTAVVEHRRDEVKRGQTQLVAQSTVLSRRRNATAARLARAAGVRRSQQRDLDNLEAEGRAVQDRIDAYYAAQRVAAAQAAAAAAAASTPSSAAAPAPSSAPVASPPAASGGRFGYPCSGPVTSGFGFRSSPGGIGSTNHMGVDFGCPYGAPIVAAAAGTVISAGPFGGYGNAVLIDHGGGFSTLYGHMSSIATSAGAQVAAGQQIGSVGSTGNSTGPHCHFEVHINGAAVDPSGYL